MRTYTPDPDATLISTQGADLACLRWGEPEQGPLVVLVHGFPDTARTWDHVGPRLAEEGFDVVAPYTRGYAPSPVPADGRYDSDTLGMDIIHLIEALGREQAIVVGHDWGASAAYAAAGLRPERVSKLATLAIPHPAGIKPNLKLVWDTRHFIGFKLPGAAKRFARGDFAGVRTMYERWSPGFDWPDSEFESVKNSYSAPGCLDAALGYYRALSPKPTPGLRARVKVRTRIFGGLSDGALGREGFESGKHRFDAPVDVVMLPGGHFLHREAPEAFTEALLAYLNEDDA